MIIRPTHINFYASVDNLLANEMRRISIEEAESIVAKHRAILNFNWIESISEPFLDNSNESRIIDPSKLAMCYFGPDVGFSVVACKKISKGELLVFAGEFCAASSIDPSNPYVYVYGDSFVNAREQGGFASLLMDVPNKETLHKLNKYNLADIDRVVTQNLEPTKVATHPHVHAIEVSENIEPGCILGVNYLPALRLTYNSFVSFFKSGARVSSDINRALNHVIEKEQHHINLPVYNLEQTIKNIAKEKFLKALNYIQDSPSAGCLLSQLYDDELDSLLTFINTNETETCNIRNEVLRQIIEERASRTQDGDFFYRKISSLILQSNAKQIAYKGKGPLHLFKNDFNLGTVVYPGIEDDYRKIAECWNSRYPTIAKIYFELSAEFAQIISNGSITAIAKL